MSSRFAARVTMVRRTAAFLLVVPVLGCGAEVPDGVLRCETTDPKGCPSGFGCRLDISDPMGRSYCFRHGAGDGGVDAFPDAESADVPVQCMPGEMVDIGCGRCGMQTRTCGPDRRWLDGPCTGEGECMPGEARSVSCGEAGSVEVTCSAECTYPSYCPLDVMLLVDVTDRATVIEANADAIANEVVLPLIAAGDVHVGLAYFGDVPLDPFGVPSDMLFGGLVEPTDEVGALAMGVPRMDGGDPPEGGILALHLLAGGRIRESWVPTSRHFSCSAGRTPGGCFRPGAMHAILMITESSHHNGPPSDAADIRLSPYPDSLGLPGWDDEVLPLMRAEAISLFAVVSDRGPIEADGSRQLRRMVADLGQDPSHVVTYPADDGSGAIADLREELGTVTGTLLSWHGLPSTSR